MRPNGIIDVGIRETGTSQVPPLSLSFAPTLSPTQRTTIRRPAREPIRDSIYAELQPLVKRLLFRYGDNREDKADLKGEIYCRFCDVLEAYDPSQGIPIRPYLIRHLTVSVHTYARRRWRERTRLTALPDDSSIISLPNPTPDWDDRLFKQLICAELPELLASIPQRQRVVVVWRYYDGVSYQEIAARLGVQLATARSLLRHGINNLRNRLRDLHGEMDAPRRFDPQQSRLARAPKPRFCGSPR